jgi:hypothetical protein
MEIDNVAAYEMLSMFWREREWSERPLFTTTYFVCELCGDER